MTDFFLIGPPRSGGTLFYSILCSDPTLNPMLKETHFVTHAVSAYALACERLPMEESHFFSDLDDTRDFFSAWVKAFIDKVHSRYASAEHLAIKSITLGRHCADLAKLLPEARFLVSVRDPRDIIASMITVGQKQEQLGRPNQYPRNIEQLALSVMTSYRASATSTAEDFRRRTYFAKYEELTSDPVSSIAAIERWTGLDFSGFDLSKEWPRSLVDFAQHKTDDPFLTEQYGIGISSKPVGRFQSVLTDAEITHAEQICAPMMKMFRYPPHNSSIRTQSR